LGGATGELVEIKLQDVPTDNYIMAMSAAYRMDAPPGVAERWLIERLKASDSLRRSAGRAAPKSRRQGTRQLAKKHKVERERGTTRSRKARHRRPD
jgi:hypothetical protein